MKRYILVLSTILLFTGLLNAQQQETPEEAQRGTEQLSKKDKKALKEDEKARQKAQTLETVKTMMFVVEASRLTGYDGSTFNVLPAVNFVSILGNYAVIQLSFYGMGGYYVFRDFTVEGQVTQFKLDEGKPGRNIEISIKVDGAWIGSQMFMTIQPDGYTSIDINWTKGAPRLNMEGELKANADSKVNQSRPINR